MFIARKLLILFLVLVSLFCRPDMAVACMNGYEKIPGVRSDYDNYFYSFPAPFYVDNITLQSYINTRSAACNDAMSKHCSDLVVAMLYHKDFKQALVLSATLAAKFPDEYNVVITHAAALELNGFYKDSRTQLEHAIMLNPASHKGSEWIHKNILDARINGFSPANSRSLLNINFGDDSFPRDVAGIDTFKLIQQLYYQIEDRQYFTPQNDTLFGALLFDYANLLYIYDYRVASFEFYDRAMAYGYETGFVKTRIAALKAKHEQVMKEREERIKERDRKFRWQHRSKKLAIPAVIGLGLLLLAGVIILRRRKNISAKNAFDE